MEHYLEMQNVDLSKYPVEATDLRNYMLKHSRDLSLDTPTRENIAAKKVVQKYIDAVVEEAGPHAAIQLSIDMTTWQLNAYGAWKAAEVVSNMLYVYASDILADGDYIYN